MSKRLYTKKDLPDETIKVLIESEEHYEEIRKILHNFYDIENVYNMPKYNHRNVFIYTNQTIQALILRNGKNGKSGTVGFCDRLDEFYYNYYDDVEEYMFIENDLVKTYRPQIFIKDNINWIDIGFINKSSFYNHLRAIYTNYWTNDKLDNLWEKVKEDEHESMNITISKLAMYLYYYNRNHNINVHTIYPRDIATTNSVLGCKYYNLTNN